jgi:hypothetical protein
VLEQDADPPNSQSPLPQPVGQQAPSEVPSEPQSQAQPHQTQPQEQLLPAAEQSRWPEPTQGELKSTNRARHYDRVDPSGPQGGPGEVLGTLRLIGTGAAADAI